MLLWGNMKNKTPEELIQTIKECCDQLGWRLAIPNVGEIPGIIAGDLEYLREVLPQIDDAELYELAEAPERDSNDKLH